MVERYRIEADCTVEPMNASMYESADGEYVEYDAYAALEAERDELQRRLDAVAARLEPGEHDFWCDNCQKTVPCHCETDYPLSHWCDYCDREVFHFDYEDAAEDAKAIAEGRKP